MLKSLGRNINPIRPTENTNDAIFIAMILLMPFIMFSWMLPFLSEITLGNDYQIFAIQEQMELMFSLKTGSFPLYIPAFAGGQSSSALTQGQLFHPLAHIAAILPGYWTGKALEWNTFLRIISLGIAHLFLYKFLRRLRINPILSLALSTITVYNLRMLDLFRYGASFESWTGFLFLCSSIGLYCLNPTKIKGPLAIVVSTYLLVCSGHPQMMYYGLIGGLIFALIIPFYIPTVVKKNDGHIAEVFHFWKVTGASCLLGFLLSSVYIIPFYFDFLSTNAGRVDMDYRFANTYLDTFIGTINNFINPLRADVHSAFGGTSLFIIPVIIPLLKIFRVKMPRIIWILWGICLIIFLHMQGSRLPIHYYAWKYLPFASSIRIAGRISIILPVFFMLLLAWVVQSQSQVQFTKLKNIKLSAQTIVSAIALILMIAYLLLPESITKNNTVYWPTAIREIPCYIEAIISIAGIASFIILMVYKKIISKNRSIGYLLFIIVCIQILFTLPYGTWVERKKGTLSYKKMLTLKNIKLTYYDWQGQGMETWRIANHGSKTFLEPFIAKIYHKYKIASDNINTYEILSKGRSPEVVVLEKYQPGDCNIAKDLQQNNDSKSFVEMIYASYNRLGFNVHTTRPGFFVLAYPYTSKWKVAVNDVSVKSFIANGAYIAVCIPPGKSDVEFRYFSNAMLAGVLVSCITFFLIFTVISILNFKMSLKAFVIIISLVLSSGIFLLWYASLYNGKNLETKYHWQSKGPIHPSNIAYGKKVLLSSVGRTEYGHINSGGKAVDGDISPGSGFLTKYQKNPSLTIKLNNVQKIGSVNIFGALKGKFINSKPLEIRFAITPGKWVDMPLNELDKTMQINMEKPVRAKYVQIRASGNCILALDEVEIFPAKK